MPPSILQILAFSLLFSCTLALSSHQALAKRHNAIANRSAFYGEDSAEMTKRSQSKFVFMHHVSSISIDTFMSIPNVILRSLAVSAPAAPPMF